MRSPSSPPASSTPKLPVAKANKRSQKEHIDKKDIWHEHRFKRIPLDREAEPDKFVYAQGDTLKASHSDTSHGEHTYRAATNAFLKACVDHYGSQMGTAIVQFLQADIEGGKPLTAQDLLDAFKAFIGTAVDYMLEDAKGRALVAQINPIQAQELEERYPYDPATSGARRLANIPAPVNPAALPQNKAGRKQFLLKMLPIYHNHERTFDNGTNLHGRTHATRAFVFSITMGNILREKGVTVDMNAVALATAGHDTGRRKNGRETADSEKRSAETVVAAVNETYPGAAGPLWSAQIEANITSRAAEQETIEGYLFKSADSLDYSRVDDLDEKRFPFLKEPIATPEGFVLPSDKGLRRQLMKEAKLL